MNPFLLDSDQIIVLSHPWYRPKANDVVIVRLEKKPNVFCKRIKRVRGEEIWIEGDNNADSYDSKRIGFISKKKIIGKMIFKL